MRLREPAAQYRRYGDLRLHVLLRQEGLVVNRKRTYRVYRAEGLSVRKRLRKRLPQRERLPITVPDRPNHRWSLDFASDQLWTGRRFLALCIVDDCTKECLAIYVDFSISGLRLTCLLEALAASRGRPREIVLDNGPEMTSKAMFVWSQSQSVCLRFIQPGKPVQNAFAESFIGRSRDECLNEHWFGSLLEGKKVHRRIAMPLQRTPTAQLARLPDTSRIRAAVRSRGLSRILKQVLTLQMVGNREEGHGLAVLMVREPGASQVPQWPR